MSVRSGGGRAELRDRGRLGDWQDVGLQGATPPGLLRPRHDRSSAMSVR